MLLNLKTLLNIPIKSALWTPNHYPTKIVVRKIPPEIPIQELKEGLADRNGNPIPAADVTQLGKPNANDQSQASRSYSHSEKKNNILGQTFLFGQMKPHNALHIKNKS